MDLPAMAECPYTKGGRHCLMVITPGEDAGDLTFVCSMCGATRRVKATGSLYAGTPLDDWPAVPTGARTTGDTFGVQ